MRTGIVYGVRNLDTGKIEMVGSTFQPLEVRAKRYKTDHEWFRNGNYEHVILRTVTHEDPVFFPYLLRVTEGLEIGRHQTWCDEGGRNKITPVIQFLASIELQSEIGIIGGQKSYELKRGVHSPDFDSHALGMSLKARKLGIHAQTREQLISLGKLSGAKCVANRTGVFSPDFNPKTGGFSARDRQRGFHAPDYDHTQSAKGPKGTHTRYHVRGGMTRFGYRPPKPSTTCPLCQAM